MKWAALECNIVFFLQVFKEISDLSFATHIIPVAISCWFWICRTSYTWLIFFKTIYILEYFSLPPFHFILQINVKRTWEVNLKSLAMAKDGIIWAPKDSKCNALNYIKYLKIHEFMTLEQNKSPN